MQTCPSLRFLPSLRAVSPGQSPRRQRPRPMSRCALEWKGASPLPDLPRPTCAIGWRAGLTGVQCDLCTLRVPGLLAALSARRRWNNGPYGPGPRRVCRAPLVCQTAPSVPHPDRPSGTGQSAECDGAGSGLPSGWTFAPLPPVARPAPRCGARRAGRQAGPHTPHLRGWGAGLRGMSAVGSGPVFAACPSLLEG